MKLSKTLLVLALVALVAVPAFAETQNVKVSGSIDAYGFYRNNYDLTKSNDASVTPAGTGVQAQSHVGTLGQRSEADNYFRTNTQVEVSADLTDNVSTVINLVNERDWNKTINADSTVTPAGTEYDVQLDLAYVQMKEIFYSPLTLTVGRQDLWFGRGFIIGSNNATWNNQGKLGAPEYSVQTAFDAVRATLDFNPWTLDFAYSKVAEGSNNAEDDVDLYIANVNYKFAEYNAVAEGYFVGNFDNNSLSSATKPQRKETDVLGARVQFDPISQITLGGELAYQFGDYIGTAVGAQNRERDAWGLDVFGTYRFDNAWKPELTLEYVVFTGEKDLTTGSTEHYGSWNSLYRGKFWTAYADFREFVYATGDAVDQPATTNQEFIQVKGSLKPLEDLLLEGSFTYLWNQADVHTVTSDLSSSYRSKDIGYEIDLQATYDYTEDVSFGVLVGWFVPGSFYSSPNDATATDLVGSLKVAF
jgi:hypothetical protein